MKVQSLIIYGSDKKLSNSHRLVTGGRKQPAYYIRADLFNGDVDRALEKATPKVGETVLNTVPLWPRL